MTMGPKNKPIKLRILEGHRSRTKIHENVPEPPMDLPLPPSHLDAYALEEWRRIAEGLNVMGILSGIDQAALAAYCMAYGRWRKAEEELKKLEDKGGVIAGLVQKTISGNWIQQPLIGISNKAAGDMVRYACEFGMTPSARARLAMDPNRGRKSKFDGLVGVVRSKK